MKNAICFLTVRPLPHFYDFCKTLQNGSYDVFICIDDNSYEIPNYNNELPIIKYDNRVCEQAGFKGTVAQISNRACSRDKALYHFCKINTSYTQVWFIEEDVFIPSINTIQYLDNKHKCGDLLTQSHTTYFKKNYDWWWPLIYQQTPLNPPYAISFICAIRVSNNLLRIINDYADQYKSLFMDEAFFSTLAFRNELSIIVAPELSTIEWRRTWNLHEIKKTNLYHPMKSNDQQYEYRNLLG